MKKLLIMASFLIFACGNANATNFLIEAVRTNNINGIPYGVIALQKTKINPNQYDELGKTALHWAVEKGSLKMIQLLFGFKGINLDRKDNQGLTPLHYALQENRDDIARELVLHGANVDIEAHIPDLYINIVPRDYGIVNRALSEKAMLNLFNQ